ncbi:hypothetical protein F5Y17DRAFT_168528 [Xylariaceae sp. FL0594]|nr:hypothetical protein F5Y17DRAFT_168528 [Xylariaceae sp. FL0594]
MSSHDSKVNGLLSLPPEIRDQIYSIILHPNNNRIPVANEYWDYDYHDALVLFRLNRHIYHEARDVFRKLNVFVRVETPWPEAENHVNISGHVPIIATGPRADRFTDHSLLVHIEAQDLGGVPEQEGQQHQRMHGWVILMDDLPLFTKSWFYWDLSHPGLNQWLSIELTLRDPYTPSWDEKHVRREVQRRLLLPFGDVKGLHRCVVTGDPKPQPKIAAELRELQAQKPASPERCLSECLRLKNEGNALLQKGEIHAALETYTRAWLAMHIVVKGHQRLVHAEAFFSRELTEEPFAGRNGQLERMNLRIQLVANTCLAYLKLADWEEVRFWGMRTIRLMRQATGANDREVSPEDEAILTFPSAAQTGKIYYRTAVAYRELGDVDQARRLLRVAQVYLPNDATVKKDLAALAIPIG